LFVALRICHAEPGRLLEEEALAYELCRAQLVPVDLVEGSPVGVGQCREDVQDEGVDRFLSSVHIAILLEATSTQILCENGVKGGAIGLLLSCINSHPSVTECEMNLHSFI
jgi:hypothetical protein